MAANPRPPGQYDPAARTMSYVTLAAKVIKYEQQKLDENYSLRIPLGDLSNNIMTSSNGPTLGTHLEQIRNNSIYITDAIELLKQLKDSADGQDKKELKEDIQHLGALKKYNETMGMPIKGLADAGIDINRHSHETLQQMIAKQQEALRNRKF